MAQERRKHPLKVERSYRSLIENIQDYAIFMLDKKGRVTSWDQGARKQFGYTRHEIIGKYYAKFFTAKDKRAGAPSSDMETALLKGRCLDERKYVRKNNSTFWSSGVLTSTTNKKGMHQGFSKIMRDVTEQKNLQKVIMHRSTHDFLTSLPNRRYFEQELIKELAESSKKHLVGLLFLDFNNFKRTNDEEGHRFGDLLLIEIAKRLVESIRNSDMVARLGGDEFVILLRDFENMEEIVKFAEKILSTFRKQFVIGKRKLVTSVSIGIAIHPPHGEKAADLLHHSDIALYEAKKGGGNKYVLYNKTLVAQASRISSKH